MGQLIQGSSVEKIVETIIAPLTVTLLLLVANYNVNLQYEIVSYNITTENDANFDASEGKTPVSFIKLYLLII